MDLFAVTESLCAARALSRSSFLIHLLRLTQSTTKSSSPLWYLGIADSALTWFISYLTHLSGHMKWLLVQTLLSGHWCPSRRKEKGKDCPSMDLSVSVKDVTVSPSTTAWNLENWLHCTPNINAVARSWRFALSWIRSFLTKDATQPHVQTLVMSCLNNCDSLLAGLPASVKKNKKRCCLSRTLQHALFPIYPNSSIGPPSSVTSAYCQDLHTIQDDVTGVVNDTAPIYVQTQVRPHAPACLHYYYQLARWYRHCWDQTKVAQLSHDSSLFWHLSGEITFSDFSSTLHSIPSSPPPMPPPPEKKEEKQYALVCPYFINSDVLWFLSWDKCTHCK